MWLLLVACAGRPDPCEPMCDAAAQVYGACLEEWGVGWPEAGYEDEADYIDACQTWAWEMRRMGDDSQVDEVCRTRAALLSDEEATCEDYTGIDWDVPTWD